MKKKNPVLIALYEMRPLLLFIENYQKEDADYAD